MTFAELLKVSSTKAQVLYTAYSKAKLFPENLSNNSDLDDSRISLPAFSYLESIWNIHVTPKLFINLDNLSKSSGLDCIPLGVFEELWAWTFIHISELFIMCLKEFCFPESWKVSSVIPLFKNAEERFTPKSYRLVIHLSVASKVFEKLVNNRFFNHFEKYSLFSDLQHGRRSSRSTADLPTVVSNRIARAF